MTATGFTHAGRALRIDTPLGEDTLLLRSFYGQEAVSQLFRFEIELMSEKDDIPFDRVGLALVIGFLASAPGLMAGSAQPRPDAHCTACPAAPRAPFGIYVGVPVEQVLKQEPADQTADDYLTGVYAALLNPAVAGLTLQIHWDTLNPDAPTDASPYFWNC